MHRSLPIDLNSGRVVTPLSILHHTVQSIGKMKQQELFTPQDMNISSVQQTGRTSEMVRVFDNPQFGKIRTAGTAENPLFCAVDVARALGYANPAKAIIDHCKGVTVLETPTSGGVQNIKFIKESEVYRLIFKSNAPNAEKFNSWLAEDVLPTIRKTGSYSVQSHKLPQTYAEALRELADKAEEAERLQKDNERMKPKEVIYDRVMQTPETSGLFTTRQIAQEIGWSATKLYKKLIEIGLLFEQSGIYMLYQPYSAWGLHSFASTHFNNSNGEVVVKEYLKWTVRGRAYILSLHESEWDKRIANRKLKSGEALLTLPTKSDVTVSSENEDANMILKELVETNNERTKERVREGRKIHGRNYGPYGDIQGILPYSESLTFAQNMQNIFSQISLQNKEAFSLVLKINR